MAETIRIQSDAAARTQQGGRSKTILLVDDSDFERFTIRAAVEGLTDFRVCGEASNGADAIKMAAELKPDLVVMDLAMPRMDGLEAARVLKTAMPEVPIMMLTLYADEVRGAGASASGIATVLSKVDGLAPFLTCVKKFLGPASSV